MRKTLILTSSLAGLLMLAACNNATGSVIDENNNASSSAPAVVDNGASSSAAAVDDGTVIDVDVDGAVKVEDGDAADSDARVVNMDVTNWAFTPSAITAKKGEKLTVHLNGVSGIHSFAVADLGINEPFDAGETKDVTIPTDKPGTYAFRCSIPCGEGHKDMTGTITITE